MNDGTFFLQQSEADVDNAPNVNGSCKVGRLVRHEKNVNEVGGGGGVHSLRENPVGVVEHEGGEDFVAVTGNPKVGVFRHGNTAGNRGVRHGNTNRNIGGAAVNTKKRRIIVIGDSDLGGNPKQHPGNKVKVIVHINKVN